MFAQWPKLFQESCNELPDTHWCSIFPSSGSFTMLPSIARSGLFVGATLACFGGWRTDWAIMLTDEWRVRISSAAACQIEHWMTFHHAALLLQCILWFSRFARAWHTKIEVLLKVLKLDFKDLTRLNLKPITQLQKILDFDAAVELETGNP